MPHPPPWTALAFAAAAAISLAQASPTRATPAPPTSQPIDLAFNLAAEERPRVLRLANQFLTEPPRTITSVPAPHSAGGLHDYSSDADYFWPNPANPNGPYINRDGYSNPANFNGHRELLFHFGSVVPALVAAFKLTGDARYANHAVAELRAWFVDPATRMNPSLSYAQAVRNKQTGRSYGIIDTLHLVEVARAVVVLRQLHGINPADDAAVTRWFADYIHWLTTDRFGITEGNAKNNHAACYWEQIAAFAAVTSDQAKLAEAGQRYKTQLLPQMAPNGSFPLELARTKPYGYSLFNLDQLAILCQMLSTPTDDLWHFTLPTGQSIAKGLAWMYPYVKDKSTWPKKPDVMYYEFYPVRSMAWLFGGIALHEPKYLQLWTSLPADPTNAEVQRNVPLCQPVLWE